MTALATINPWAIVLAAGWVALAAYWAGHTIGAKRANRTRVARHESAETAFWLSLTRLIDDARAEIDAPAPSDAPIHEELALDLLRAEMDAWNKSAGEAS